jgi:hypothetical protein
MAIDRRETTQDDLWRNPPLRAGCADTGKSAQLNGCVGEGD